MSDNWNEKAFETIHEIYANSQNFSILEEWLAGLIFVECGRLDPRAARFEKGVFDAIILAKHGHTPKSFPGFASGNLHSFIMQNSNRDVLTSLATSYGFGQIMGYHYLNRWGIKPGVYTNLTPAQSVTYTLSMMQDGLRYALSDSKNTEKDNYQELLRWWNTGSINGRTYDPKYPDKGYAAMLSYRKFLQEKEKVDDAKPS